MTPTTLLSLAGRCETEQGSRELDVEIARVFEQFGGAWKSKSTAELLGRWDYLIPHYTTSLDAKLPGEDIGYWEIRGPTRPGHPTACRWSVTLHASFPDVPNDIEVSASARTERMARLAAALKLEAALLAA